MCRNTFMREEKLLQWVMNETVMKQWDGKTYELTKQEKKRERQRNWQQKTPMGTWTVSHTH